MNQSLGLISLVVKDYDEAIKFYTIKLNFELVEDTYISEQDKRWVVVCPKGNSGSNLLLAKASTPEQSIYIGNQTGGRVFLFLYTDNFWRDYESFKSKGIEFIREPKQVDYGTFAVFKDLYGNQWDLLEPSEINKSWKNTNKSFSADKADDLPIKPIVMQTTRRIYMKWEYKTFKLAAKGIFGGNLDETTLDKFMNELGSEGWELVSGFDTNQTYGASRDIVVIFKRPVK